MKKPKPPTNTEVATLVEYVRKRIKELKSPLSLVEFEEFVKCVEIILPILTEDEAKEIVRVALHTPVQNSCETPCETTISPGRPSKLSPEQQTDALERLGMGESQAAIARSYDVDPATINRLRSDKWNLKG